jgi:hypothetical protein
MSQHQTAEENHYVKVTSKYSLKCGQVKMFANDGNDTNCIYDKINSRLNLWNAYCHAVKSLCHQSCYTKRKD